MGYIYTLLIINIIAISLSIKFNKKIEQTIPLSVITIIIVIYIFGIFDKLLWGIYAIKILTILQIVYIAIKIYYANKNKKIKKLIRNIITPGLLIYVVLVIVVSILNKGKIFEDYDEFNHWAIIIKNMFQNKQILSNVNTVINYSEYPPLTAIFQYFVLELHKIYSEDIIITAQSILYFSIIIPITKNIKWKKIQLKNIALALGIAFIPIILKPTFYLDILVDAIIGIMFAFTIYNIYVKERNLAYKNLMIYSGLIMLALTKTSGLGLAILAIGITISEICKTQDKKTKKQYLKIFSILMIIFVIIVGVWYIKVEITNSKTNWNFTNIINIKSITEEAEIKKEIIIKFITAILYNSNMITEKGLTVLSVLFFVISINILIYKNISKKNKEKYTRFCIYMLISTIVYYIILLYMYLTIFDIYEAYMLTCLGRYCMTILLADIVFNFYIIYEEKIDIDKYISFIIITIMIMFLPTNTIMEKYIDGTQYNKIAQNNRDIMTKIKIYKDNLAEESKIYYITGISTDLPKLLSLTRYIMMPINIGDISVNFGISKEKFIKNMIDEHYTHIYIYRVPDTEKEIYSIFENQIINKDTLYEIQKINDTEIKLIKVK